MDNATWSDVFTTDELAAALDVHSMQMAKRYGNYSLAADLSMAAACIRDLSERMELAQAAATAITRDVAEVQRVVKASLESLSKLS